MCVSTLHHVCQREIDVAYVTVCVTCVTQCRWFYMNVDLSIIMCCYLSACCIKNWSNTTKLCRWLVLNSLHIGFMPLLINFKGTTPNHLPVPCCMYYHWSCNNRWHQWIGWCCPRSNHKPFNVSEECFTWFMARGAWSSGRYSMRRIHNTCIKIIFFNE